MSESQSVETNMDIQQQLGLNGNIRRDVLANFETSSEIEQNEFVQYLLSKMSHYQHSQINLFLKPMLQRDFITLLPSKY